MDTTSYGGGLTRRGRTFLCPARRVSRIRTRTPNTSSKFAMQVSTTEPRRCRTGFTVHVPREVGLEVQSLAQERSISVSACAAALISEALRVPLEHEHGALLEAVVERYSPVPVGPHRTAQRHDCTVGALLRRSPAQTFQVLVNALGPDRARVFRREIHSNPSTDLYRAVRLVKAEIRERPPAPRPDQHSYVMRLWRLLPSQATSCTR
jgi:hypothetical protein